MSVVPCHAVHLLWTRLKGHWIRLAWHSIRNRTESSTRITASMREVERAPLSMDVQPLQG